MNIQNKKGFSLVELLLVLGVLAILLVAAFVAYPQVKLRNQVNEEQKNLVSAASNIRNMYVATGDYAGVSTGRANTARVFTTGSNNGDFSLTASVQHLWDGDISVLPDATNNRQFIIRYTAVPQDACGALVSSSQNTFVLIQVNGVTVWDQADTSSGDPAVILSACNQDLVADIDFTST